MTKKIFILLISSLLLCSCENIETDTANETAQKVTESPAFLTSTYIDTSDLTYTGDYTTEMFHGYSFEGDSNQTLTLYFNGYESKDGEIFAFDEHNRLRYYSLGQYDENTECTLSEEQMREICDNVLSEIIPEYEKYKYSSSFYDSTALVAYELLMVNKTDSTSNGVVITLTPSGEVRHMNISYYDLPDEAQIDHEYFNAKFDEKIKEYEERGDIHHYTVDDEKYYLVDDSVYAVYTVTFYDNPISEDSEDYAMFCEGFGFAKSLE